MNGNYYYIKKVLKDYSEYHPLLQGYELSFNDQRSMFHKQSREFPILYGVINSVSRQKQVLNWNVRIWSLDILLPDRSNEKDVMNSNFEILNDFYNYLTFRKVQFRALSSNLIPLNNYDDNRMNGWYLDISLETPSIQCIDFEGEPIPPEINSVDWFLYDGDGNVLQSGETPCGSTLEIIQPLGEPATYEVVDQDNVILATGSILPGNFEIISITASEGLAFQISAPNREVSSLVGDVGWRYQNNWWLGYNNPQPVRVLAELDWNHNEPHFNLKGPISFRGVSSTKRFVDIRGGQDFITYPDVFIDKLTGLTWIRGPRTGTEQSSFSDTAAFSITTDGITLSNWFIASVPEVSDIYSYNKSSLDLSIVEPGTTEQINFGTTVNQVLVRTSSFSTTSYTTFGIVSSLVANLTSASNRTYMIVSKELLNQFDDRI